MYLKVLYILEVQGVVDSVFILQLREEGFLDKLRQKWWDHRSDCEKEKPASATTMRISLDHMAGVFIVLAGGIVVSIVFLLIERRCSNLKEQLNKQEVSRDRKFEAYLIECERLKKRVENVKLE